MATNIEVVSAHTEDENTFLQEKAEKRNMSVEDFQKEAALNFRNRRYKDKRINEDLTKVNLAVTLVEEAIKDGRKKSQIQAIGQLKAILGEMIWYV